MHRCTLLALACALVACTPTEVTAPAESPVAPAALDPQPGADDANRRGDTRLTIYSGDYDALAQKSNPSTDMPGYALVERPLHYALKAGGNAISATGMPPTMDVEAAMLQPQGAGIAVESQRFIAALAGTKNVLATAIGHKVAVEHTSGGAKQTDSGTLLSADDGLTLALADGRVKLIRNYDNLSILDSNGLLPKQATLQWNVRADKAGDAVFVLSYPMGGMAWRAEYLATVAKGDGCKLALDGAALVTNRSGVTVESAKLTLVAGEPNRKQREIIPQRELYAAADSAVASAGNLPAERTSGEYHAYELPNPAPVTNGATERIALFAQRPAIACERAYVVDAGGADWQPPGPVLEPDFRGATGTLPVTATVSLHNTKAAGLGQPLPAGRVRVFDGNDLLGESRLEHTAEGAEIRLEVGKAFDLGAERESSDFRLDRSGRTLTESFAITLSNAKPADVSVRVIEPLPRWSDWEIIASSLPSQKKDARHAEFSVPVPAGGETRLTYTVRYRWAKDVNP